MKISFALTTVALAATALVGCSRALWAHPGHAHGPHPKAAPSKPAHGKPAAIFAHTLGETDAGHTFSLRVGEQIAVKLASNASTGYEWVVLGADSKVLAAQGQGQYLAGANPNHMAGVPGSMIWRFKALKPGQAKIKLGYLRHFEKVAPVQTWTATVNVK